MSKTLKVKGYYKNNVKMFVVNKLEAITETSCLVNVMHEILLERWMKGVPAIASCPTQRLEKHLGADALLPDFDKMIVLQFKAYKRINHKASDYFKIYPSQHNKLLRYPFNCAFYVFPDYKTHTQMSKGVLHGLLSQHLEILSHTWFVEVHSIPQNAKRICRHDLLTRRIRSLRWYNIADMMERCLAGFRIVKVQDHYILMDPEEREVEVIEIPSGTFSFLYTKIAPI